MKVKIPQKELLEATQALQGIVSSKSALPILSNILLNGEKETLILSATDLDIAMVRLQKQI